MHTTHARTVLTPVLAGIGLSLMLCTSGASAHGRDRGWDGRHGQGHHHGYHHRSHHRQAPVVVYNNYGYGGHVDYGYRTYVPAPTVVYRQAYTYQPPVYSQPHYAQAYATPGPNFGNAVGGALGGYIGSQIGNGSPAATAAGAVVGFVLGGQAGAGYRY